MKELIVYLIKRPILGKLKLSLFPVLVGGILIDWRLNFDFKKLTASFSSGGTSEIDIVALLLIFIFAFTLIIDFFDKSRRDKRRMILLKMASDPNLDSQIKDEIIKELARG